METLINLALASYVIEKARKRCPDVALSRKILTVFLPGGGMG